MTKARFDSDTFLGGDALLCPGCGGNNLHQGQIDVWQRQREDGATVHSIAAEGVVSVGFMAAGNPSAGNPSSGRDGLTIAFSCENCPAEPVLAIWQHKGCTFVEWRK